MKDIRPALRNYLLADPTINALVGGVRIHHMQMPENQFDPSIVYTEISEVGDYNLAGDSGLNNVRMQINSIAIDPDTATQLADAVRDRISGARDIFPPDVAVRGIYVDGKRNQYDEAAKLYLVGRDYLIWYALS